MKPHIVKLPNGKFSIRRRAIWSLWMGYEYLDLEDCAYWWMTPRWEWCQRSEAEIVKIFSHTGGRIKRVKASDLSSAIESIDTDNRTDPK